MAAVRKRDLLETLANDDPSAFGYDKKRKRFSDDDDDEDEDDMDEMDEVGMGGSNFLPLAHLARS